MGLDTVELIVCFEKHFQLTISDAAAGSIGTVGEMAAWLGQQLNTPSRRESAVRATVAARLGQLFAQPAVLPAFEAEATPLLQLLPNRAAQARYAALLLTHHGLQLPELPIISP